MLLVFLFSFSLFFFVAFIQRLTIFLSPPPPLCYFCGLQRKIKNIKERSCPSYRATTDLIDENEERRKDCRFLFVVRGKSFRTEVHRSLFLFLFQIWPCWTRWWTRRKHPGTRRGSRIVCFITVPGVCTVSRWKVTVTVITSTSVATNRGSNVLIASWRASKRRRSIVT